MDVRKCWCLPNLNTVQLCNIPCQISNLSFCFAETQSCQTGSFSTKTWCFFSCCRHVVTIFSAPNYCYRLGTAETSFLDLMAIGWWPSITSAISRWIHFNSSHWVMFIAWVLYVLECPFPFWGVAIKQLSWKLMNTWSRSAAYLLILVKMVCI